MKGRLEEKIRNFLKLNFKNRCVFCNEERLGLENVEFAPGIEGHPVKIHEVCSRCVNLHFGGKFSKKMKNGLRNVILLFIFQMITLIVIAYGVLRDIPPKTIWHWILRSLLVFFISIVLFLFSVKFGANIIIQKRNQKRYSTFLEWPHFGCPNCHTPISGVVTKFKGDIVDYDKYWDYDVPGYHYHCSKCNEELMNLKDPKLGMGSYIETLIFTLICIIPVFLP